MSKQKIALIEFDYHAEVLRNTLYILQQPDLEVEVFTTEKIWKQVNWQGKEFFKTYLQRANQSLGSFLKEQFDTLDNVDLILYNTVASNYRKWSELDLKPLKLLRIHNANTYFSPLRTSFSPKFTPFYIWKDSSHFVRKTIGELDWMYRKKFVAKIDHFIFPSESIKNYVGENYPVGKNMIWSLPFGFWTEEKQYPLNKSNTFKICIIGKVDQRNRDYDSVVKGISGLLPYLESSGNKLELILLGTAASSYGKRISKELHALTSDFFIPTYFDGFVPQNEFDQHIKEADFFIIPTKIETRYTIYTERYGYTKISGSINDVIKYHKPALINQEYPLDSDMRSIFETYATPIDLAKKIKVWISNRSYQKIKFADALISYQLNSIQHQYKDTFNKILSKDH